MLSLRGTIVKINQNFEVSEEKGFVFLLCGDVSIPMFQDTLGAFVSAFLTDIWTVIDGLFSKKKS